MRITFLSFVCVVLLVVEAGAYAQEKGNKPITENGLVQALKIGGLSQPELIEQVKARHVDFILNPAAEDELRKAGAGSSLLEAVRANQPEEGSSNHTTMTAWPPASEEAKAAAPAASNAVVDPSFANTSSLSLRSVHKLYLERMPNNLDQFLREAIFRKCGSFFTIVLNRKDADAIMKVNDPRLPGTVAITDPAGTVVLWSGSADTKESKFLNLKRGGEKVLADKLAGQLKHAIGQ